MPIHSPVPHRSPGHGRAVLVAVVVTVLWSSSWVLIRVGLDDEALPPITFAGLRYGLAAVVLLAWVGASGRHRRAVAALGGRDAGWIAVLGLVFYAVTQGAQFVAIDSQPAATTSLVLSLTPLLVALAGSRSLGETSSRRQLVGGGLVAGGAWLYFSGALGATAVGLVAAGVALGANTASSLLGRLVNRHGHTSPVVVTALGMSVGAAILVTAGLIADGVPSLTARAAVIVAWLAVVNTALAFTLWNWSLRRLRAVESAALNNTMLVQIALLAWVFLDEAPGPAGLAGIAIVSLGVFLTQLRSAPAGRPDPGEARS